MNDADEKGWASVPTLGGEEAELAPALPGQMLRRANRGGIPTVEADNLSASNGSRGDAPTTVAQQATVALRERLRAALRRHIDPDDDTMPTLDGSGRFLWVPADSVLDDLVRAVGIEQLAADRDQAVAAVERVRAECTAIGIPHICNAVDRILAALDQPEEQP